MLGDDVGAPKELRTKLLVVQVAEVVHLQNLYICGRFLWQVPVAGSAAGRFYAEKGARCRACASAYATQVQAFETGVVTYLIGYSVRVYDPSWPGLEPGVEAKDAPMRQPSDAIAMGGYGHMHPKDTIVDLDSIAILDPRRPNRVHIGVETCYPDPYCFCTVIFEGSTFHESVIVDA